MGSLLLHPKDAEACARASEEELLSSAEKWLRTPVPSHARDLCQIASARNANNGAALRMLARLTEFENTDEAHILFRRAARAGSLTNEDYGDWFSRLFWAEPARPRQAADVAQHYLKTFPNDLPSRAKAAWWLALCKYSDAAAAILNDLWSRDDLPEGAADALVAAVGALLEGQWEWSPEEGARLRTLAGRCSKRGSLQAVRIAVQHEQYDDAWGFLDHSDRLDTPNAREAAALSLESKVWRALIHADSDDHESAILLLREVMETEGTYEQFSTTFLNLTLARSLYELGHLEEAAKTVNTVIPRDDGAKDPAKDKAVGRDEAVSGVVEMDLHQKTPLTTSDRITAGILGVMVNYDSGDFCSAWRGAYQISQSLDDEDLSRFTRASLLNMRCQFELKNPREFVAALDRLRDPGGWETREGVEVELVRLEMLAWLAEHSHEFGQQAENSLRDALAVLSDKTASHASALKRAYVALLAHDYGLARELLEGEKKSSSWRVLAMRAQAAMGLGQRSEALNFCRQLRDIRPHDLRVRCLYAEAALLAGKPILALREAESIVRFAPEHVLGHLLLAQCLEDATAPTIPEMQDLTREGDDAVETNRSGTQQKKEAKFQDYIYAARHYAQALRLNRNLVAAKDNKTFTPPLASDQLPLVAVEQAARRGVHAVLQAEMVMANAGLPRDKQLMSDGAELLASLEVFDPQEAKRLAHVLQRPHRERKRRWWARRGMPALGLAAVVGLVLADVSLPAFKQISTEARVLLFALAGFAVVWPHAHKLSLPGGLGVERSAPDPVVEIDSALMGNLQIGTYAWLQACLTVTAPPNIVPNESFPGRKGVPSASSGAATFITPPETQGQS